MDERRRGWLLAAAGMLFVSTDSFFIRWSEAEAWDVIFLVSCFTLVLYAGLLLRPRARPSLRVRDALTPYLLVAGLATLSQISFVTAVTRTAVSNVVVIVAASPLMAALVARVFLAERVSRVVATAIAITFSGVILTVAGSIGEPNLDGDLLALVAVAAFACNVNVWRRFPELSRVVGLSISAVAVIAVGAFFASPFSLDGRAYLACFAMGFVFNPLGRLMFTSAPRHAPVAEVALFTPVETVAATIWAWVAFSEAPEAVTVVGGLIVIAGLVYGTLGQRGLPSSLA